VEERLSVAIVTRCEVFVEIGNESAIICADSSNNKFESPIDADLSEWGSSEFEGRFTFKGNQCCFYEAFSIGHGCHDYTNRSWLHHEGGYDTVFGVFAGNVHGLTKSRVLCLIYLVWTGKTDPKCFVLPLFLRGPGDVPTLKGFEQMGLPSPE
jgi:hypothetical protein